MKHGICRVAAVLAALAGGFAAAQGTDTAAGRGAAVYTAKCSYCHDRVPENAALEALPGVASLMLKYGGALSPYIRERPDLADADVLTAFLRNGAGSMQPFRKTELTAGDIAAIAAYFEQTSAEPATQ